MTKQDLIDATRREGLIVMNRDEYDEIIRKQYCLGLDFFKNMIDENQLVVAQKAASLAPIADAAVMLGMMAAMAYVVVSIASFLFGGS